MGVERYALVSLFFLSAPLLAYTVENEHYDEASNVLTYTGQCRAGGSFSVEWHSEKFVYQGPAGQGTLPFDDSLNNASKAACGE